MPFMQAMPAANLKTTAWIGRLFTILFLAAYALALVAVAGTIAALTRHLPLQNVLFAALFIGVAGGAADWLDLKTGIPFGPFTPAANAGPKLFSALPWALPFVWVVAVLNSRGGAARSAAVAKISRLRLLAHLHDDSADGAVRSRIRSVCLARESFLVLGAGEISFIVAGRAAGEFFWLAGGDAADSGVRHSDAHQQAAAQKTSAGFSPACGLARRNFAVWRSRRAEPVLGGHGGGRGHRNCHGGFCNPRRAVVKLFLKVCENSKTGCNLWRIKITLAHRPGRAALLRRRLADQQVSPTGLAMCQC
jgi:hypothetical protein